MRTFDEYVDVVVVGSGPIGSTFARRIVDTTGATLMLVEAGPRLTDPVGVNVRNLPTERERAALRLRAQAGQTSPDDGTEPLACPGTHLLDPAAAAPVGDARADPPTTGMPAAAMSTNVCGMGVHWSCCTPRPYGDERIPFLDPAEADARFAAAEAILRVSPNPFPPSARGDAVLAMLQAAYAPLVGPDHVRRMPLAATSGPDGRVIWSGGDTILGELATRDAPTRFTLRAETLCDRLLVRGDAVVGVSLRPPGGGASHTVGARYVVVAADALRTPQLLHASGIRPPALGRYLNDHAMVVSEIVVGPRRPRRLPVRVVGVYQVPYRGPALPWHGQLEHLAGGGHDVLGVGWYVPKELRREDRVAFSDDEVDAFGMPKATIHYGLTPLDRERIGAALADQRRLGAALGHFLDGQEPRLLPAGSSLHYQGTVRIGAADDGESVCDPYGRVWGYQNLYLGGNGLIPTSTACNPTLTSVALALRGADAIAARLTDRLATVG